MITAYTLQPTNQMADEWTTVTSKRRGGAAVDAPSPAAAYVPPSMRTAVAARQAVEDAKKPLNFKSEALFPSLGSATTSPKGAWASKTNFKKKVEDLIEKDKQTAEERAAEEEARKAMEGWEVLRIPQMTAAYGEVWDNYVRFHNNEGKRLMEQVELGLYVEPLKTRPVTYSTTPLRDPMTFKASRFEPTDDDADTESEEEMAALSDLD